MWETKNWIKGDGYIIFQNPDGFIVAFIANNLHVYYTKAVSVNNTNQNVNTFSLSQNYPNPFNPSTTIEYSIPKTLFVVLKIYDILGREITTLVKQEEKSGNYKVKFNGSQYNSGIYFYKLQAGSFSQTKKLILVK